MWATSIQASSDAVEASQDFVSCLHLSMPYEGPLDDPALWDDLEALGVFRAPDDLQSPVADLLDSSSQLWASIAAVGEDMAQPWAEMADGSEEERRAVPILKIGSVDSASEDQTQRVDQNMALAALDLLACVIAANPYGFCGFHALAVDDPRRRLGLPTFQLPRLHRQIKPHRQKDAPVAPVVKIPFHRRARRETLREHPPLATAARYIDDAFITSRRSASRGQPIRCGLGRKSSTRDHSGSVRSLA